MTLRPFLNASLPLLLCLGLGGVLALAQEDPGVTASQTTPLTVQPLAPVTEVSVPVDVPFKPDQVVLEYLIRHGYFQPFANQQFLPNAPMTRAQLVTLLYRASQMNTPFVSEFPYYRDVPTGHWAYVAFEGFRMRGMLPKALGESGWLKPDKPVTRLEAAVLLSRTFEKTWLSLSDEEEESTLKAFSAQDCADWAQGDLARILYAGLLTPQSPPVDQPDAGFQMALDEPLTRMDGARMVYQRALVEEADDAHRAVKKVMLPAGMTLAITPTSAISAPQLAVGQAVYFTTTQTATIPFTPISLGRGSRVGGVVTSLSSDHQQVELTFSQVVVPSGESYTFSGVLQLTFGIGKNGVAYRVPGEEFSIKTR